jgi:hypothetical protein
MRVSGQESKASRVCDGRRQLGPRNATHAALNQGMVNAEQLCNAGLNHSDPLGVSIHETPAANEPTHRIAQHAPVN